MSIGFLILAKSEEDDAKVRDCRTSHCNFQFESAAMGDTFGNSLPKKEKRSPCKGIDGKNIELQ